MNSHMESTTQKTPLHLWVTGGLALVLFGWGAAFGIAGLVDGTYTDSMDLAWTSGLTFGVLGAVTLLLHRRWAMFLFAMAAVIGLASLGFLVSPQSPTSPSLPIVGLNGFMLMAFGIGFFAYARSMARSGVLR